MTFSLCSRCGREAVEQTVMSYVVEHSGKHKTISDERMRCSACENLSYQGDQISKHERAVANAIRELDGLLSADDLCRIRLKYRFKQIEMEQMLSTGPKTWTRWERGKVPHGKAADKLIRVMAEDPEVARRLMEQAGIQNADAVAVFDQIERDAQRLAKAAFKADLEAGQMMNAEVFVERFYQLAVDTMRLARKQAISEAEAA